MDLLDRIVNNSMMGDISITKLEKRIKTLEDKLENLEKEHDKLKKAFETRYR